MNKTKNIFKLILIGVVCFSLNQGITWANSRPNIVLIMVDDMGFADLGCYGSEINTPHLDKLATHGLRFTQFYNTAKCHSSRASLLTGCYAAEVGESAINHSVTLAEVLQKQGYTTLMTGKWHLHEHPMDRGFERYFGHLSGATNFFKGDNTFYLDRDKFTVPDTGFYTTNANTDYAIKFLDHDVTPDKPFFLYIAYNAPHYPLHALPEDIEKYRGKYMKGWDALRKERHARQIKMGLVKPEWGLTPRDENVPAWDTLSPEKKREEDLTFAVYAAMIDRVDQNIGRLISKLDQMGVADNTLLLFVSDNGGCPFQRTKTPNIPPGPADSYWTYHKGWAQVSNVPFRLYKQNQHEGGISTPLIAYWPGVVKADTKTDQPGHLVDFMATALELSGGVYPKINRGQSVRPLRGKSLVPILKGGQREPHEAIYLKYGKYKGVRANQWKIAWEKGPWELYNIDTDRCEQDNVADQHPEILKDLVDRYEAWETEVKAFSKKPKNKPKKRQAQKNPKQ
jgi:arylsulfatase A-like enzyme